MAELDKATLEKIEAAVRQALNPILIYDVTTDTHRPATQQDVDNLLIVQRAWHELHRLADKQAADFKVITTRLAQEKVSA